MLELWQKNAPLSVVSSISTERGAFRLFEIPFAYDSTWIAESSIASSHLTLIQSVINGYFRCKLTNAERVDLAHQQ